MAGRTTSHQTPYDDASARAETIAAAGVQGVRPPPAAASQRFVGKHQGEVVTFDGTTVRVGPFETSRDFELNGNFRRWLAARGVVLP